MRSLVISLLVVAAFAAGLVAGHSAAVTVAPQPEWTVAGELSRPRVHALAVALATGEVLIVGGLDPQDELVTIPTSELFDPATGRVTVLPDQVNGRVNQAITTGWGDRVVMTGGQEWLAGGWRSVSRTDVYLPYSRTWLRGSNMRQPRGNHGSTALLDGRILVTGGNHYARFLKSTEIYDPETDIWDVGRPLPRERTQFTAATLPDGRVLVAGGSELDGLTRSTWLYDPEGDTWDRGPLMREVRLNHSMVRLPGGDLLFFGGEAMGAGTAERYVWREQRFEHAGVLGEPRLVAQGVLLPDGRVLAVGGLSQWNDRRRFLPTIDAEMWDPVKRVWLDFIDPPTSRAWAEIVATDRGVFRISGVGDDEVPMRTIEALTWH